MDEEWKSIKEFPNYSVSNYGRVHNDKHDHLMSTSRTNFGHVKISLVSERSNTRHTRSVALLVAEAFVRAPSRICDNVMILDGDLENVVAWNLSWRPRWFAWKYIRQLRTDQSVYYQNLPVRDVVHQVEYDAVIYAGMDQGLLFEDIWVSTYTSKPTFPTRSVFKVIERV